MIQPFKVPPIPNTVNDMSALVSALNDRLVNINALFERLYKFTNQTGVFNSTQAPQNPYDGQIWNKKGAPMAVRMRFYDASTGTWHALMTGGIVS